MTCFPPSRVLPFGISLEHALKLSGSLALMTQNIGLSPSGFLSPVDNFADTDSFDNRQKMSSRQMVAIFEAQIY
jgi:hypothetical protein